MNTDNLTLLIHRFQDGDCDAINQIIRYWYKPILNYLYRFLGNMDDAEDVCQQTFVKVYKHLKTLKKPEKFKIWIYRIALNEAKNNYRWNKRNKQKQDQFTESENRIENKHHEKIEAKILDKQVRDIFERLFLQIPVEQRVVIILKIYQDLKFSEVAELLSQSENTVKSRFYYGLRSIRKIIEQENLGEELKKHGL